MSAGPKATKNKLSAIFLVNEQPIRLNVTLSSAPPITAQSVVSVVLGQRFPFGQLLYDCEQRLKILTTLFR